jgi:FkbM family methyltransferase
MLFDLFKLLITHPLNSNNKINALLRFLKWQIAVRISPYPIVYPFTENSKLIISRGMTGATGNLYCGLHEFCDMSFLLHILRSDDIFVDVGANIGSYTILASAEIGANTVSIEPVPVTFGYLKSNILINNVGNIVEAHNIGIAGTKGIIRFTKSLDTVNHVATIEETDLIEVQTITLDDLLHDISPYLIKIDVEGYETEVFKGADITLAKPSLNAVIVELNGSGKRYGFDDNDVHQKLIDNHFLPYVYQPFTRALSRINSFGSQNTIYIRDFNSASQRVKTASAVRVNSIDI